MPLHQGGMLAGTRIETDEDRIRLHERQTMLDMLARSANAKARENFDSSCYRRLQVLEIAYRMGVRWEHALDFGQKLIDWVEAGGSSQKKED